MLEIDRPEGASMTGPPADFRFDNQRLRTILTEDTGATLRRELEDAGLARALIVCSPREAGSSFTQAVVARLGELHAGTFDEVASHPTLVAAGRGAAMARSLGADCLVAIGGGGSSDQAKGIALWLATGGDLEPISAEKTGRRFPFSAGKGEAPPIVAVPSTASGAELTPGFGQKDASGQKRLFRDVRVFPSLIVLDPAAMAGVPDAVLVPTCMNAIAHCVEALYSNGRDPISGHLALAGFDHLVSGLRALAEGDRSAYRTLLVGANLAGRSIVNARTGLHHGICHVLGAVGVPHGVANTIMLPHVIRFNADAGWRFLAPLAARTGAGDAAGLADAVVALARAFGLPARLRESGLDRQVLPILPERILREPGIAFNPRRDVTAREITALLEAAW
jgi:alcohol dehydrogenase